MTCLFSPKTKLDPLIRSSTRMRLKSLESGEIMYRPSTDKTKLFSYSTPNGLWDSWSVETVAFVSFRIILPIAKAFAFEGDSALLFVKERNTKEYDIEGLSIKEQIHTILVGKRAGFLYNHSVNWTYNVLLIRFAG